MATAVRLIFTDSDATTVPSEPALPLADGSLPLGAVNDPLLVDPGAGLLADAVAAFRDAAPELVAPNLETLRASASHDPLESPPALPTLTVLAGAHVFDVVTEGFHDASRLAALVEADCVTLLTLAAPQPNPVLAGADGGCVLVENTVEDESSAAPSRYRVGDDATLRGRYERVVEAAEPWRLRTPSRHRVYGAFHERCEEPVAGDVIRLLDADPEPTADDPVSPRVRAYVAGARHGALDRSLRRACEDAGLGSPSTFTRIKRRLLDAGLVDTDRVPQPVGRPRERIVAGEALSTAPIDEVPGVVAEAFGDGDG